MYTEFYKLTDQPFQLTPDHRFFYGSSVHNRAMAHLTFGLSQGEGFIIITGDVGAGKTTLMGHLLETIDKSLYVSAKIVTTHLAADDMLRMVAYAFGLDSQGVDKATLLRRIEQYFESVHAEGKRCLLMVDEVQNLSFQALEELRMLSNFQIGGKAALQSFLLGQPQFRQTLASSDLDQLRQRVIASYHLGPVSEQEIRHYIEHRLKAVGWDNDPEITEDAYGLIYKYTSGVPRRINVLCSRILLYGFLEEEHTLGAEAVKQVAEDLSRETEQVVDTANTENTREPAPEHVSKPAEKIDAEIENDTSPAPTDTSETAGTVKHMPRGATDDTEVRALKRQLEAMQAQVQRHERMLRWTQLMLKHHERMLRRRPSKIMNSA